MLAHTIPLTILPAGPDALPQVDRSWPPVSPISSPNLLMPAIWPPGLSTWLPPKQMVFSTLPGQKSPCQWVNYWKAIAQGLIFRSVVETIADTLAWDKSKPTSEHKAVGLSRQREAEVLTAWQAEQKRTPPSYSA